jgi:hypothetical protein
MALRGRQPAGGRAARSKMQLTSPASGAGREDAGEPGTDQLLARGLKRWPGSSSRRGRRESHASQPLRCAGGRRVRGRAAIRGRRRGWRGRAVVRVRPAGDTTRRSRCPAHRRDTERVQPRAASDHRSPRWRVRATRSGAARGGSTRVHSDGSDVHALVRRRRGIRAPRSASAEVHHPVGVREFALSLPSPAVRQPRWELLPTSLLDGQPSASSVASGMPPEPWTLDRRVCPDSSTKMSV